MIRFAFMFMIFTSTSVWATAPACSAILSPNGKSDQQTVEDLTQRFLTNSDQSNIQGILNGSGQITWQAYRWILDVKAAISANGLKTENFLIIKDKILEATKQFTELREKEKIADINYRFYEQLLVINNMLGGELFPDVHLQFAEKDQTLKLKAEQIVQNIEGRIRKLYRTAGYSNTVDFVDYIEKHSPKNLKLLELINDGLIVTIRRPEGARFWIPLTGFQNQRVTRKSKGIYDPNRRNSIESDLAGIPSEDYSKISVRLQPQYGEARPDFRNSSLNFFSTADAYGPDMWVLKKEVVEKRTTWTQNDSFAQIQPYGEAKTWNQMFIPWTHREFMAPFLLQSAGSDSFFPSPVPFGFNLENGTGGYQYFETQIWGPVALDDVEAFVFTSNEPDVAFAQELKSRGIKIYDGRSEPMKPYGDENE